MAQSSNGVDLQAVVQLLHDISGRLDNHDRKLNEIVATVNDHIRRFDEVAVILNDHGRKLDDLAQAVTDLRGTVGHYHHSVIGQGIVVNDLDERVKRLEERLALDTRP